MGLVMSRDLSRGKNLQNSAWSEFQWLWSYSRLPQLFNINLLLFEETILENEIEKNGPRHRK